MQTNEDLKLSNQMMSDEELLARVAWFYYHDGLTQADIGSKLGIARLKVSRLLEKGRQSGVIRVNINSRYEGCLELERILQKSFSLQHIRILPTLNEVSLEQRLGVGASNLLMSLLQPNQLLAVGFGEATMSTLQHLTGFINSQKISLVTLSGGVGQYMTGFGQLDPDCHVSIIPAPLRASSPEVAKVFFQESSISNIMETARSADIAVVGIGSISQQKEATIVKSGYISDVEQLMFSRKKAVGDILGYFIQADGSLISDLQIHAELMGISLNELTYIPTVIGVAGGENKSEAIIAALKGRYINALVTEEQTARVIVESLDLQ